MEYEKISEYSEVATRAILESLEPNRSEFGEYTRTAIQYAMDQKFKNVLQSVAKGMGLEVVAINQYEGIILLASDETSPFSAGLSWINKKLSLRTDEHAKNWQGVATMALISLLAEAFPEPQTMSMDWSSSAQFSSKDVLAKLHNVAKDLLTEKHSDEDPINENIKIVAQKIVQNEIPKYVFEIKRNSVNRSQLEIIEKWISLMEEYGLLIKNPGYQDEDDLWMATKKLKRYLSTAGMISLIDKVKQIQEGHQTKILQNKVE